jgi:DNA invertase Pin-like site-specific DNA recombinase
VSRKQENPPRINAIIYTRVSTQDQVQNFSLETQETRCRELCQTNGWPVVQVFREEGQSAKTTRRDQFQKMLQFSKNPKNGVGFLVVYDFSRFARNMLDQLLTESDLKQSGVRLESVKEPSEDTAIGRLHRNMLAMWNQFDNDRKSERTVARMMQAAKSGRFPFKAPLGYINVSQHRGHNLIPDAKTAPLVTKAFELAATGLHSKAEILAKVNSLGLRTRKDQPSSAQTLHKLLQNPIYAGWVTIPKWDLKMHGNFEPLVTNQLFDQVQDWLAGRRVTVSAYQRNHPDFPLRVFVRCGNCGEPLTGAWSRGRKKKYPYYRCRKRGCGFVNIRRETLEAEFIRLLRYLTPSTNLVDEFTKVVKAEWKRRQGDAEQAYAAIQHRLATAKGRKDKLVNLRLDGEMDQRTYQEQAARLDKEVEFAEQQLRATEAEFLDLEGVLSFAGKIVTIPARLWMGSALDQQQKLQQTLFPDGLVFNGERFGTAPSTSFFSLLRGCCEEESHLASPTGFEPVLSP